VKVTELQQEMHQLSGEVKEQFERVDGEFVAVRAEIAREGEATRRHFDVVAEQIKADHALLAAGIADLSRKFDESRSERHTVNHVLDDHEVRLKALERGRSR
jgi:chromosome segregation ATPase